MKLTAAIIIALYALVSFAQDAAAPAAPAAPAAAGTETAGDTNAPSLPLPPKDPAQCLLARFTFDNNIQPDIGSRSTIPTGFKRPSAAWLDGAPFADNAARFTEGRFGKALLLESAYENIFSAAQAGACDPAAFTPLQNAALAISAEKPWEGKECLSVTTPGANAEEGFAVEAPVEKAFYAKEAAAIVPAYYTASLYLKGQGNLKMMLKDAESGTNSEPVYVDLPAAWQRFQCTFGYKFNRINIGADKEAEWRQSITNNIGAKLQLICATVDASKMIFFADGLQLEKRHLAGRNAEFSPHTWIPGASKTAQEQFGIDIKNDYFNTFKKNGTIAFWFKPMWEARDGGQDWIMNVTAGQLMFYHDGNRIMLSPAGVLFTPYDWKNNWHHIAITWSEAGERVLYVDGTDYPNASGELRPIKNAAMLAAGDLAKNLSPNGAIDELTLYNAALTADQAKALFTAEPSALPAATPAAAEAAAATTPAATTPATDTAATAAAANAPATIGKQATTNENEEEQ